MKHTSIFVISLLLTCTVFSQVNSVVSMNISGNKNLELTLDGYVYNLANATTSGNKTSVLISTLEAGPHSFIVSRTDLNTNRAITLESDFHLRNGFDMDINVNLDGSLELIETRISSVHDMPAISNVNFNKLMNQVRLQKSVAGKRNVISNALATTQYSFTTSQLRQLLTQVYSESFRLQLAKEAYPVISDRGNFHLLYSLLNSQASRNELADFVYDFEYSDLDLAMSESDFNYLYQSIQQQWPVSKQMTSLTAAMNDTNHYFTTSQAGRLIQLVSSESNRLQLAKLSYRLITDRDNFSQIYELLYTQAGRNELEAYVNQYNAGTDSGIHNPMPDADFNSLYQTIQQQWPVSAQMNSLANAFNNTSYFFSTYQASRLIQLVGLESNRLQLAKLSYRSITDPGNFYQVKELLYTQESKNELQEYVNNYSSDTALKTPMSDADFNTLYQTIERQFFPNEQMNSLTSVFSNTNYYFTTTQVKLLIPMVSLESNRVRLAKLAYRAIVDRQNFTQLYDLFSNQSSKDELDEYVRLYKD